MLGRDLKTPNDINLGITEWNTNPTDMDYYTNYVANQRKIATIWY